VSERIFYIPLALGAYFLLAALLPPKFGFDHFIVNDRRVRSTAKRRWQFGLLGAAMIGLGAYCLQNW
jgi:hypothetical protein